MATPLLLFGVAALVGGLVGYPLSRARWTRQAPRLGVALWHALCFGVASSVVLGGMALALPALPLVVTGGLGDFLARCAMALRAEFAAPHSLLLAVAGLLLALTTIGRVLVVAVTTFREARGVRRGQLDRLEVAGRRLRGDHGEALILLMDDRPAAYCLPGRWGRGTIVISSGSLDMLADDQLRLVLAHERAHLRQRHHVAARVSGALSDAFGWVPLFRLAAQQVPMLLEMAADDQALLSTGVGNAREAGRSGARRRMAHALLTLATARPASPAGALAAAGGSAVARVRRLSEPSLPLGPARVSMLGVGILVALAGPLLVASSPALCAAAMEICPFAFS
jgi:Zn-dependent protease with chaperone function